MNGKIIGKQIKKELLFLIVILLFAGAVKVYGLPWAEPNPSQPAPEGTIKAPLNIGPLEQTKVGLSLPSYTGLVNRAGGIGANDFWIQNPLTGSPRWASGIGGFGGCDWEGLKCHCNSVGSGQRLVLGVKCEGSTITNFNFLNFNISSGGSNCPDSMSGAPYLAQCNLYTYQN